MPVVPFESPTAQGQPGSFAVLPIEPKGKRPLTAHGVKDATRDQAQVRAWWARWPDANVGAAMGARSGLWCLDIDPRNGGGQSLEILQDETGPWPVTWRCATGGGGQHFYFRLPLGAKIVNCAPMPGIDVLSDEKYTILPPSVHPSGVPYQWFSDEGPDDVEVAFAPQALIDRLLAVSAPAGGATLPASIAAPLTTSQVLEARSALAVLSSDDYEAWIRVGMALYNATNGGDLGYGLWEDWSRKSEKFNSTELRKKWRSFRVSRGEVNLPTIFSLAQDAGWVNPASNEAADFEQRLVAAQRSAKMEPRDVEEPDIARVRCPFPQLLELEALIGAYAELPSPQANRLAALSVLSAAASRGYQSEFGDPAHLYFCLTAESVGQVRYATLAAHKVLCDAGLRKMTHRTRLTSPAALLRTLLRSPATMYLCEEWAPFIEHARRDSRGETQRVLTLLAALHDERELQIDFKDDAGGAGNKLTDEQPVIRHPSLSIFALAGAEQLPTLFKAGEFARGAVEQMLFATARFDGAEQVAGGAPTPDRLLTTLRAMRGFLDDGSRSELSHYSQPAEMIPNLTVVPFDTNLDARYAKLLEIGRPAGAAGRALAAAARSHMRRLCVGLAAFLAPRAPVATSAIVDFAADVVAEALRDKLVRARMLGSDEGKLPAHQQILVFIRSRGKDGVSRRDMPKFCRAYRNLGGEYRGKAIDTLLDDESIVIHDTKNATGRPGKVLIAAEFVKKPEE